MNVTRRIGFRATLLVIACAAHADENFRCGQWVVSSGMTLSELMSKCGQPTSRNKRTEPVLVRNRNSGLMMKAGETSVETLTFDRGARAEAMVVTVVDGKITSIDRKP